MTHATRCALLILAVVICVGPAFAERPDHAAIDSYVRAEMDRLHIPGLALAVVKDGDVVYQQAYGLANVELKAPVTTDTVFQIQSVTKTFTAAAVMMLVEEGKVALDDPAGK